MSELFYDAVEVYLGRERILQDLHNTQVEVEAGQQVEDGYILILSGTRENIDKVIAKWEKEGVLLGC